MQFFPAVGPDTKSGQQYFDESLRLTEFADIYGYSHIRIVEHYFHPYGGYTPNPIVFLLLRRKEQKKARIVTGAVLRFQQSAKASWRNWDAGRYFGRTR